MVTTFFSTEFCCERLHVTYTHRPCILDLLPSAPLRDKPWLVRRVRLTRYSGTSFIFFFEGAILHGAP